MTAEKKENQKKALKNKNIKVYKRDGLFFFGIDSLKWQILSIAIISVVGFFTYFLIMSKELHNHAVMLKEIRDVSYPIQERMLSAHSNLELIHRELSHSADNESDVFIGDVIILADEFITELDNINRLESTYESIVRRVKVDFEQYYNASIALAQYIHSEGEIDTKAVKRRADHIDTLHEAVGLSLRSLIKTQNVAFTNNISSASKRADDSVIKGYYAGFVAMFMVFMVALLTSKSILIRINEIVSSLKRIAQENGDMSVRIKLNGRDEMTELAHWFNTFIEKLETMTKESTSEITRIAYTDNLSKLPNRRKIMDCLDGEISYARHHQSEFAVFFLDLDNFKPINDQLGHEAGDELIRQVAKRLSHVVCGSSDICPVLDSLAQQGRPIVGRLGGDEFMAIMPGVSTNHDAQQWAEKIRSDLLKVYDINGTHCQVGVSIGISLYPRDAEERAEIIDRADLAMYDAKNNGKNTYRFYDSKVAEAVNFYGRLDQALSRAIENKEFILKYQPKFDFKTGEYAGAEALIRWDSPELGFVSPDVFITHAEKSYLIYKIDEWVLNEVCQQIAQWVDLGLDPGRIAVNMSAKQTRRTDLLDLINKTVERHHVNKQHLELEITETSALDHIDIVSQNIHKLRSELIHVAMDDFGAGHSSLQLLINCQIDTLKIDKSLINQLQSEHRSESIVKSIISLAETLSIATVAEGIETEKQYQSLKAIGCHYAQGYLLSEPISSFDITDLMKSQDDVKSSLLAS